MNTEEKLYFAYGSNMNLNQMAFRCPDAEVVDTVRLEGYRLAFCMNGGGNGVATILPEEGSCVDGVLWRISERDERHLDHYEGFPYLYGKEPVVVTDQDGIRHEIMAYTMNSPYKDTPAMPSKAYLEGILNGCRQNGIESWKLHRNRKCPIVAAGTVTNMVTIQGDARILPGSGHSSPDIKNDAVIYGTVVGNG